MAKERLKLRSVQMEALHYFKEKTENRQEKPTQTDIKTDTAETEQSRDLRKGKEKHSPPFDCLYSNVKGKKIILSRCLAALHLRKMHGIKFLKS